MQKMARRHKKATDRRQWKTLMEGYIVQWMDKAWVKGEKGEYPTLRFCHSRRTGGRPANRTDERQLITGPDVSELKRLCAVLSNAYIC